MFEFTSKAKRWAYILIAVGLVGVVIGFMNKFFFFFTFSFLLGSNPSFSESSILKYRTSFNFHTEKLFGKQQELEASDANI